MTRCARPRWLYHWRSLHLLCAIGDRAHERLAVEGNRATWASASAPVSISHPKRTLGHRSRLERFAKFCQCVSVPTGRRTVNTEPLPVSLVTVHVAAHHARAFAGDGKAELGAAVSPRARVRPPTLTSTSMLSRTAARARVRPLSRVR